MHEKHVNSLEKLQKSRDYLKNFNRQYKVQQKGIYEHSEELFKPLIEEQKKANEAIKTLAISNQTALNQKQLPEPNKEPNNPVTIKSNQIGIESLPKTLLFTQNEQSGDHFLNGKKVEINGNIIKLSNSNTSYEFTDNLSDLLNGVDVNIIDNHKSLEDYRNILDEAGSSKQANRYKNVMKRINEVKKQGHGIITISENPKDLWDRLQILITASKEGHNNTFEEQTAILSKLMELGEITHEDYKKFLHKK